jgi:hypothetical protein
MPMVIVAIILARKLYCAERLQSGQQLLRLKLQSRKLPRTATAPVGSRGRKAIRATAGSRKLDMHSGTGDIVTERDHCPPT